LAYINTILFLVADSCQAGNEFRVTDKEIVMTTAEKRNIPWYLWPFWAIWMLVATILEMVGRFVAIVIGLVFMLVGVLVSLTIIGAIVGIPLAIIGFLLVVRGIF
jgi:hypothetical protein